MKNSKIDSKIAAGWAKFMNPEVLKVNLLAASIYLAAYEILRNSVVERLRDFFSGLHSDATQQDTIEYKHKVLALDKSRLKASLLWFHQMGAIDVKDMEEVDQLRCHRNQLAHNLPKFLTDSDFEVKSDHFAAIKRVVAKVDRWWIREVEMTIDPDLGPEEMAEIPDSEIMSGNMMFIELIIQLALNPNSAELWEGFQKEIEKRGHAGLFAE